jgi:hypothetical protein
LGIPGLSTIEKVTAALRMLYYGVASDTIDEYILIGESTASECMKRFCSIIFVVFGTEYLRLPTKADVARWWKLTRTEGFLDCLDPWIALIGPGKTALSRDKISTKTKAVNSQLSWKLLQRKICGSGIGMPGSNNDINVVERSPLVGELLKGEASKSSFQVNGKKYDGSYLLCDGDYPCWAIFIKTIAQPQGDKNKHFAKMQETMRKYVER